MYASAQEIDVLSDIFYDSVRNVSALFMYRFVFKIFHVYIRKPLTAIYSY